jgi:hypothetical protein
MFSNTVENISAGSWSLNYDDYVYSVDGPISLNLGHTNAPPWYGNFYLLATAYSTFGWEGSGLTNAPIFESFSYGISTNDYLNNYSITSGPTVGAGTNLTNLNLPGLNYNLTGQTNGRPVSGNWNLGAY